MWVGLLLFVDHCSSWLPRTHLKQAGGESLLTKDCRELLGQASLMIGHHEMWQQRFTSQLLLVLFNLNGDYLFDEYCKCFCQQANKLNSELLCLMVSPATGWIAFHLDPKTLSCISSSLSHQLCLWQEDLYLTHLLTSADQESSQSVSSRTSSWPPVHQCPLPTARGTHQTPLQWASHSNPLDRF